MSVFADITEPIETIIEKTTAVHPRYKNQLCAKLHAVGMHIAGDMLFQTPLDYEFRNIVTPLSRAEQNEKVLIRAQVQSSGFVNLKRRGRLLKIVLRDETARAELHCYGREFLQNMLQVGSAVFVWGKFTRPYGALASSAFEIVTDPARKDAIVPRYGLSSSGISQAMFARCVAGALKHARIDSLYTEGARNTQPDSPDDVAPLLTRKEAIRMIHFPRDEEEIVRGRAYLAFDELLLFQISTQHAKASQSRASVTQSPNTRAEQAVARELTQKFVAALPFELTAGQTRVINEIAADMRKSRAMRRILQADVGAGKTVVSLCCALEVIANGAQVCLAVPSEALALQHYKTARRLYEPLDIRVGFLTGSMGAAVRDEMRRGIECGDIMFVVGTHAVYSQGVEYCNLQLAIIDEQHRFGIAQRAQLLAKGADDGESVHALLMSATPIPRSLALTLYSGMDVSIIPEKPAHQAGSATKIVLHKNRAKVYPWLAQKISGGEQAFFVFPAIASEESSDDDKKKLRAEVSAVSMYDEIARAVAPHSAALLHSKIPAKEREDILTRFAEGDIRVLVSTTIIEIGIDVPRATMMCVFDAQCFGLATLHQLRGRVGRAELAGETVLVYRQPLSDTAKERLKVMYEHTDGFVIAERDLLLRGPGDVNQLGARQSGSVLFAFFDMADHTHIIKPAHNFAARLLCDDPKLEKPQSARIKHHIISSAAVPV